LLTPGFFTDATGFLLLFPPFRVFVMRNIKSKLKAGNFNFSPTHPGSDDDVIEGKFKQVSSEKDPSGWTKD
jgi:UPF0716 protein FxsA